MGKAIGGLSPLGRLVTRHRSNPVVNRFAGFCRRFLGWHGNHNFDIQANGEARVLETLAAFRPAVIFDAGANVGEWTIAAKASCPDAAVHAFEIAAPTHAKLVENTRHLAGVRCNKLGLSDEAGSIPIRYYEDIPAATTATEYPHAMGYREMAAEVVRGDAYAVEHGIDHIDLLKIDVEGMESSVLRGFEGLLSRGAVDLVQFEYGRVSILTHFLLRDFHAHFTERGYVVGKLFPDRVDFREYELTDEDFMGSNHLACRKDRADLLKAFGGEG